MMLVYGIFNVKNENVLIGQTTRNLKIRWKEHLQRLSSNIHENPHLQNAFNLYGKKYFICEIIDEAITQEELDWKEDFYIKLFEPNVYNLRSGGHGGCKFDTASIKRMCAAQQKRLKEDPNFLIFLKKIAKIQWQDPKRMKQHLKTTKQNWQDPILRKNMLDNLMKYAKNSEWKSKLAKEFWQRPEYRKKFEKLYGPFISPTGEIYKEVWGIRKFSRDHNLDPGSMIKLQHNKMKSHKGWRLWN